jgi:hypothetical protein
MDLNPELLDELARCFVRAALDRVFEKQAPGCSPTPADEDERPRTNDDNLPISDADAQLAPVQELSDTVHTP